MSNDNPEPRLAFLVLAHEHPALCARLARRLLEAGDAVFLHLDAKCDDRFRAEFEGSMTRPARYASLASSNLPLASRATAMLLRILA